VAAAALVLALVALVPVGTSDAAMPGLPGQVAFQSDETGNFDIWIADRDGTNLVNLTNHAARDQEPAWSFDGTRIAFTSDRNGDFEIFVMNADGTGVSGTGVLGNEPNWSPDGKIYFNCPPDPLRICVLDPAGSGFSYLGPDTHWTAAAKVSPDGTRIAFSSQEGDVWNVWIMDIDGSNAEQLTFYDWDFIRGWSPDGSTLLFMSQRAGQGWQLYGMNADGSDQRLLLDEVPSQELQYADFSPDGTEFLYHSTDGSDDSALFIANADGSNPRKWLDRPGMQTGPAWQPINTNAVAGRVTFVGIALPGVEVWLAENYGSGNQTNRYACTDAIGQVHFDNVPVGVELLMATGPSVQQPPCDNADFSVAGYDLGTVYTQTFQIDANGTFITFAPMAMCEGEPATMQGTFGNDTILGTSQRDVIVGLSGDDLIKGKGGNDLICGGEGNDTIRGQLGNDVSYGGPGDDRIQDGPGLDVLYGGDGKDRMWGGIGDDSLYGGDGNDQLHGGRHNDDLHGGPGTDRIWGNTEDDALYGDAKSDFLYGGSGVDSLYGGDGNDRLYGQDGDDFLYGENGKDQLRGQSGDDANDGGPHYDWCSTEKTISTNCEKDL
jgi:Tol biopolymer transport system component